MRGNNFTMAAMAIGILAGLIISVVVIKFFNKDGKVKTKWDEMQKIARGQAYKYGFWTILALEAVLSVIASGDVELPWAGYVTHVLVILIGVAVQASYSIWNNAYIGLNTDTGHFGIASVVIALFNFAIAGMAAANGKLFVDGKLQGPGTNLFVGIIFCIIGVELLLKKIIDNNAKED